MRRGLFMSSSLSSSSWCFYIYLLWHCLYTSLSKTTTPKFRVYQSTTPLNQDTKCQKRGVPIPRQQTTLPSIHLAAVMPIIAAFVSNAERICRIDSACRLDPGPCGWVLSIRVCLTYGDAPGCLVLMCNINRKRCIM